MELLIPDSLSQMLKEIGEIGDEKTYLVGGSVRDLLLTRPTSDIDIVVEGNAVKVAEQLKSRWGGSIQTHEEFGTATVSTRNPDYPKIDFVTARRETYKLPGTLPNVEPGTIDDDLMRRDFSINALAMSLDSEHFGTVIDKTCGIEDLESGTIRVLHKKSYSDDPTRIFRACRYAGRYDFSIYETDLSLIKEASPLIAELSGERIRNEMMKVFLEDKEPLIIRELDKLGVFKTIFKEWKISPNCSYAYEIKQNAIAWALKHLEEEQLDLNYLNWITLFGICSFEQMSSYQIEAISYRLVLDHHLHRIYRKNQKIIHEGDNESKIREVFETSDIDLSGITLFGFVNGKWCIVDSENEETYVYDASSIFKVNTLLTAYRTLSNNLKNLTVNVLNSDLYRLLRPYPLETLVLALHDTSFPDVSRKSIVHFLLVLRNVPPIITGNDLIEWGEKPGKSFETLLWYLFAAQLDGKIDSKNDAYTLYKKHRI